MKRVNYDVFRPTVALTYMQGHIWPTSWSWSVYLTLPSPVQTYICKWLKNLLLWFESMIRSTAVHRLPINWWYDPEGSLHLHNRRIVRAGHYKLFYVWYESLWPAAVQSLLTTAISVVVWLSSMSTCLVSLSVLDSSLEYAYICQRVRSPFIPFRPIQ